MDAKTKIKELDDLYSRVKGFYKEAGWRRRNFPLLAKHDEEFNKKASKLEEEVNSEICSIEKELGMYSKEDDIVPYLTIALRTEDYRTRFNFGLNSKNMARKVCYGMSGFFGGGFMALKGMVSQTGYVSPGLTALGVFCGFALSFFMEGYASTTHQWEEKNSIKSRIKDIKRELRILEKQSKEKQR